MIIKIIIIKRILNFSRHPSLSAFVLGKFSRRNHMSEQWVFVCRPTLVCPFAVVHERTLLKSSFLLLQQSPDCLARLTWMVFVCRPTLVCPFAVVYERTLLKSSFLLLQQSPDCLARLTRMVFVCRPTLVCPFAVLLGWFARCDVKRRETAILLP